MFVPMLILIVVVALLLMLIVLVQNPKGGGLSSSMTGSSSSSSIGGVQQTNSFLDKATWTLAITLMALILLSNFTIDRGNNQGSELQNVIEQTETTTEEGAEDVDQLLEGEATEKGAEVEETSVEDLLKEESAE